MNEKIYKYKALLCAAEKSSGVYVIFPYDVRKEFCKGKVKAHATFDGEEYDSLIVNMGLKNNDGSICYIIGVRKDIRTRIEEQPGGSVLVTIRVQKTINE